MTILIANGKDFYDITEVIPKLIKVWEENGILRSEEEAIEALMVDSNCNICVKGNTWFEAAENLIKGGNNNGGI
jgi:hypothetical protein